MELTKIGFISKTHTPRKIVFFMKVKKIIEWKIYPFLNKMKTIKTNVKIIRCDNTGENKTLE